MKWVTTLWKSPDGDSDHPGRVISVETCIEADTEREAIRKANRLFKSQHPDMAKWKDYIVPYAKSHAALQHLSY